MAGFIIERVAVALIFIGNVSGMIFRRLCPTFQACY